MKLKSLLIMSIILTTALLPFRSMAGRFTEPDFDYPKTVSKTALADLKQALNSHDGEAVVDAMVRYSIAQGHISQDNMDDIVKQIEKTIKAENSPATRALLRYFEALVFQSYYENYERHDRLNPEEEALPSDYTEWDFNQFRRKITELLRQSLEEDPAALKAIPITSMPHLIRCDERGAMMVPTLYAFLSKKSLELLSTFEYEEDVEDDETPITEKKSFSDIVEDRWVKSSQGNTLAYLYARCQQIGVYGSTQKIMDLYREYADQEESGYALTKAMRGLTGKEGLATLYEYVNKYPNGFYTPEVKNRIADIEEMNVQVAHRDYYHSTDTIEVTVRTDNVNHFKVHVYKVPDGAFKKDSYRVPITDLKLVETYTGEVQGFVPFHAETKIKLKPLPYGRYYIAAGFEKDGKDMVYQSVSESELVEIYDITTFQVSTREKPDVRLFTVDTRTGAPVSGVTIKGKYFEGVTDADGCVTVPSSIKSDNLSVTKGNDRYSHVAYYYAHSYDSKRMELEAECYTDLAIYRPGETVKFHAIIYTRDADRHYANSGQKIKAVINDPNGKEVGSLELEADDFGRVNGEFKIPTDRMNGRYNIYIYSNGPQLSRSYIASQSINVSEYKTPTYEVKMQDFKVYTRGEDVEITGQAMTYSGIPVSNAEVKLSLFKKSWSWWWRNYSDYSNGELLIDSVLTTDAEGRFAITFPAALFPENKKGYSYSYYNYNVHVQCTDATGESQEGFTAFIVGNQRGLQMNDNVVTRNEGPITLPLLFNSTDENEKSVQCEWTLYKYGTSEKDGTLKAGNFPSDKPVVDLTDLPSGQYKIHVSILGDPDAKDAYSTITLYHITDKCAPVDDCALWLPKNEQNVDDKNVAHIVVGTSVPQAHIYYIATSRMTVVAEGWLHYKPGLHKLDLKIPDNPDDFVEVKFVTLYEKDLTEETIHLDGVVTRSMRVKATSFRDKLVPGTTERWTFTMTDKDGNPQPGAMVLEMFDKALNSLAPNPWNFYSSYTRYEMYSLSARFYDSYESNNIRWRAPSLDTGDYSLPELYTYDEDVFPHHMMELMRACGSAASSAVYEFADYEEARGVVKKSAAREPAAKPAANEQTKAQLDNIVMREHDVKTALWMPSLVSDEQGNVSVEFEVPNFNTTWLLQALAYNSDVTATVHTAEVLTQKPVMVKSSLPRFVRQADRVTLAANVQNATEQPTHATAIIELFNPRDNKVIESRTFNLDLAPKGSAPVTIDYVLPDTLPFIGFRVKAANEFYGDGEQVMLPVLPSMSPVIEATPFYIDAATPQFDLTMPQFPNNARVTLEYCDNPTWYCVTALPTIFSDNYDVATSLTNSLFAQVVAQGVAKAQPQIKEAVNYWREHNDVDSTLISQLAKNQDLKVGTLLASPWINEAERQTLRMSRLYELFDDALMAKEFDRIIKGLENLQMPDGGFTWYRYPECESSVYTTGYVLETIGELRQLGYLKDNERINAMVRRAIPYYDKEYIRILKERKKNGIKGYSGFEEYVYVRTMFNGLELPKDNQKLLKNALKAMTKDWKGTSLSNKGFYAITLNRNGYEKVAKSIVESIREFSITKPNLGMYWDNLNNGRGWGYDKVAITCTILRALNEVDPVTSEIDLVRKWMLLMKQTNDWGSSSLAADAVYSLLSTGSQWLERNDTPAVTLAGKQVEFSQVDRYLGYCRKTVPAVPGSILHIDRSGNSPAWGAVYCQYSAPMTDIPEVSIEEISIHKEFYRYAADGKLEPVTEFRVGDKIQVRTVIKNNKDLDYVTVTDERGACFEPVDQLSGYRYADRICYYQETKDASTNLFFNNLYKGTHVVKYDVYVTAPGEYNVGIATVQCQYAPQITAHSAGRKATVVDKK